MNNSAIFGFSIFKYHWAGISQNLKKVGRDLSVSSSIRSQKKFKKKF